MSFWDEQFDERIQYFNSGIICYRLQRDNWIAGNSSNLTSALPLKSRPVETQDKYSLQSVLCSSLSSEADDL